MMEIIPMMEINCKKRNHILFVFVTAVFLITGVILLSADVFAASAGADTTSPTAQKTVTEIDKGTLDGKRILKIDEFPNGVGSDLQVVQNELRNVNDTLQDANSHYKVIFELNGDNGDQGIKNELVCKTGEQISISDIGDCQKKENRTFVGWNTKENGTGTFVPKGCNIISNIGNGGTITLYAQYTEVNTGEEQGGVNGEEPGNDTGEEQGANVIDLSTIVKAEAPKSFEVVQIVVPAGTYSLGSNPCLQMKSNTILDLRKGVKIKAGTTNGCILRAGAPGENSKGYGYYKNMVVLGGTFDGNGVKGCNVRFGHSTNVKLIGLIVKNNVNAHHIEIGGVSNALIANCYLSGFSGDDSIEAVQLDITHRDKDNFAGYGVCDDLPAIYTTVEHCTFDNVRRGVGSHHSVVSKGNSRTYNNIVIRNNKFNNIKDRAISVEYFKDSEIAYNVMTNVNSGINISNMISKQFYQPNKGNGTPATTSDLTLNMNTKVHDNSIQIRADIAPWSGHATVKYGIRVGGESIANTTTGVESASLNPNTRKAALPKGKYFVTGVDIYNNKITAVSGAKKNIDFGIYMNYVNSSKVRNNTINLGGMDASSSNGFGIRYTNGKGNNITGNTISNIKKASTGAGIAIGTGVAGGNVNSNKITGGVSGFGIKAHQKAIINNINSNTVTKPSCDAIIIGDGAKVSGTVMSNVITGNKKKKNAILVNKATTGNISKNKIKGINQSGICVMNSGSVKGIFNNTIANTTSNSISVSRATVTGSIKGNKIFGTKTNFGIKANDAKKVGTITGNTIKTKKKKNMILMPGNTTVYSKNYTVKVKKTVKIWHGGAMPKWSSSNKKVATVNAKGIVTGKRKGKAVISIKRGKVTVKVNITVK